MARFGGMKPSASNVVVDVENFLLKYGSGGGSLTISPTGIFTFAEVNVIYSAPAIAQSTQSILTYRTSSMPDTVNEIFASKSQVSQTSGSFPVGGPDPNGTMQVGSGSASFTTTMYDVNSSYSVIERQFFIKYGETLYFNVTGGSGMVSIRKFS